MQLSLKTINEILQNGFAGMLGIVVHEIGDKKLIASAPVSEKMYRPGNFVHGGVYLALAETLAGTGSFLMVDGEQYEVLGIQISANHTGSTQSGEMTIIADLIHHGSKTHIWNVEITSDNGKRLSTARVTNMIVKKSR